MDTQKLFPTINLTVAYHLMTCGFQLKTFTHIKRADGRESKQFWFDSASPDCEFPAEQVAYYLTKGADDLAKINPEHPILWLRADSENRNSVINIVKNAPCMIEIKKDGKSFLISKDATDETKRQIASMI